MKFASFWSHGDFNTIKITKMITRGEIIGIDISMDILEFDKKNIVQEKIDNVKLIEVDAHEMDFKNKFEFIYSNITLDRCHDLRTIISLIYKTLKVNGRIMLCIPKGRQDRDSLAICRYLMKSTRKKKIFFS